MSLLSPSTCQSPSRLLVDYFSSRLLRSSMCKPVRFTPRVSHRAFHKPVPTTWELHRYANFFFGDLIDTHAQVIDTWDHISPKVRANLAYAVDPPCSRSSWRRLILAQAHPGAGSSWRRLILAQAQGGGAGTLVFATCMTLCCTMLQRLISRKPFMF